MAQETASNDRMIRSCEHARRDDGKRKKDFFCGAALGMGIEKSMCAKDVGIGCSSNCAYMVYFEWEHCYYSNIQNTIPNRHTMLNNSLSNWHIITIYIYTIYTIYATHISELGLCVIAQLNAFHRVFKRWHMCWQTRTDICANYAKDTAIILRRAPTKSGSSSSSRANIVLMQSPCVWYTNAMCEHIYPYITHNAHLAQFVALYRCVS